MLVFWDGAGLGLIEQRPKRVFLERTGAAPGQEES